MDRPIGKLLTAYGARASLRLHMPGHGGALNAFDVTELSATDDLLDPVFGGAIRASEDLAAQVCGVKKSLYSCSGATLCVQASLAFLASSLKKGAKIVCERRVHRSVLHALALLDLEPVFTENVLDLPEDTGLLIFSGCDYYGAVPDYEAISDLCKSRGIQTLVDNAHGAHLNFWEDGRLHPARYGFTMIVDSVHKTLNCLTGGAVLHLANGYPGNAEAAYSELKHFFRLFSSSSPSFLILSSLEDALISAAESANAVLKEEKAVLDRLQKSVPAFEFADTGDPFRLVLRGGYDFEKLYRAFENEGVFCECYDLDSLVMIPRFGFTEREADKLLSVLQKVLPQCRAAQAPLLPEENETPERKLSLRKALLSRASFVKAQDACGRIAGEVVGRYPPGNGLILPGEVLTKSALLRSAKRLVRVVEEEA